MRRLALPVAGLCGLALAVVPALAADQTIQARQSPNRFEPNNVTINVGEKVTISNSVGNGLHNVHWEDRQNAEMDVSPQWTTERRFDTPGTYRFYCEPHRGGGMTGTVQVQGPGGTTTGGTTTSTTPPPPGGTTTTPPPPGGTQTTPPPGGDTFAPQVTNVSRRATRRGVTVRLTLSEPAAVRARLFRGSRRVARRFFLVDESGRVTLRIRKRLRPGRYRLSLTFVDDAGNRASRSLRARVR